VQKSVRDPDFSGVGRFRCQQPAVAVAVEMWEPAFGAGFQARWDGATIFGQDSAIGPTERHFHSELGILPILVRLLSLAEPTDPNARFQKSAQNEHFYRLSCRAENLIWNRDGGVFILIDKRAQLRRTAERWPA
jgi:hypothetical protein